MKQRILVLNGQRLIEQLENDEWKTIKVAKAEELTGGVYNIFTARDGDTKQNHQGVLVHATKEELFLQCNFGFLKFDLPNDIKLPAIGSHIKLSFDNNNLNVEKIEKAKYRKLIR